MIKTLSHAAFDCYDFDTTLDFYTRVLGFEEMFRMHNEAGELTTLYLRVSDTTFLELFPKTGEIPPADRRYSHLCFEVDDLEIMVRELQSRGATLDADIKTGLSGSLLAWVSDPEGNRIEFMQITPDSLQHRAIERIKQTKIAG